MEERLFRNPARTETIHTDAKVLDCVLRVGKPLLPIWTLTSPPNWSHDQSLLHPCDALDQQILQPDDARCAFLPSCKSWRAWITASQAAKMNIRHLGRQSERRLQAGTRMLRVSSLVRHDQRSRASGFFPARHAEKAPGFALNRLPLQHPELLQLVLVSFRRRFQVCRPRKAAPLSAPPHHVEASASTEGQMTIRWKQSSTPQVLVPML